MSEDIGSGNDRQDGGPPEFEGHDRHNGHAQINLGNRNATLRLHGDYNNVTGGSGSVSIFGTDTDRNQIALGGGNDHVALRGDHNTVSMGNGNDRLWLKGDHNAATLGSGVDSVTTAAGSFNNTFTLDGSTASLVLHGSNNMVFIDGGNDTITDAPSGQEHLFLKVGSLGGTAEITNFSAAHGVVDLVPGLGFSSATQIAAYVNGHSDGAGGSMLSFNGGSIDFRGIAPGAFSAHNFRVA